MAHGRKLQIAMMSPEKLQESMMTYMEQTLARIYLTLPGKRSKKGL